MYNDATWGLVEQAYDYLDREFPGRHEAQSQIAIRFEDPIIGYDEFEVIFSDCIVRFRGGKDPRKLAKGKPERDIILAIDDEPWRYLTLSRNATKRGWVVIPVDNHVMVENVLMMYGDRILAVMLDHDIPGTDGKEIAERHLAERSLPVIITTNSSPGAKRIEGVLSEYAVPYHIAPAMGMLRDEVWMDLLKEYAER